MVSNYIVFATLLFPNNHSSIKILQKSGPFPSVYFFDYNLYYVKLYSVKYVMFRELAKWMT